MVQVLTVLNAGLFSRIVESVLDKKLVFFGNNLEVNDDNSAS